MEFHLDRNSSIPLGAQLRGMIEYAITFGALKPGEQLPSVREMADLIGVAPMTVAQVYRELKAAELVYSKPGAGTFIADASSLLGSSSQNLDELHRHLDALINCGMLMGFSASDLGALVSNRFSERQRQLKKKTVFLIGNFIDAARDYAQCISETLGEIAQVEATTITELKNDELLLQRAGDADLLLTFAHRRREVSVLLPGLPLLNISFIPSETTRRSLASLEPLTRTLVVSIFPEFTSLMTRGVERFAPHVTQVIVVHRDDPQLSELIKETDALVYATGAQDLTSQLSEGQQSFEYRHVPDAGEIQRVVVPLLQQGILQASNTGDRNENQ
ncbi:GntR family transcriptional regulator [Rouxiella sp. S1S-2]|uniref:GntR family transcriptional regulator n=1 Tax=Rouxiella sp. S1S-2 TaxID=2653856 RepID=UPI001264D41B|nr:GntR family transcriptional regulator [Rouxiella sp. S1S-2]KAB7895443.1 GntR family transcriptional regulator [Rouxiella sp. S1S-2]